MESSEVAAQTGDKVYRKITWRLLPFLLLCYMVAQIDRFNIGFAKLQFVHDLNLNDAIFGVAASMFAVGYVIFEVPSNLMLARIGVRKTLLRIMVLWGIFASLLSFAQGAHYLYIMRFLLGVAEAGFFPGIIVYLTYWYPDRHRGRIMSLFVIAVPIAGAFGGPLAGVLMDHFQGIYGLRGWQWLFLIEGFPAVALGVIAFFYLQDKPEQAGWLSPEEKQVVIDDLEADRIAGPAKPPKNFREALGDPKIYLMAINLFCLLLFSEYDSPLESHLTEKRRTQNSYRHRLVEWLDLANFHHGHGRGGLQFRSPDGASLACGFVRDNCGYQLPAAASGFSEPRLDDRLADGVIYWYLQCFEPFLDHSQRLSGR